MQICVHCALYVVILCLIIHVLYICVCIHVHASVTIANIWLTWFINSCFGVHSSYVSYR